MHIDSLKIELIDWIAKLHDPRSIKKLLNLKEKMNTSKNKPEAKIFGSGKELIGYIADDFNEPLEAFNSYKK